MPPRSRVVYGLVAAAAVGVMIASVLAWTAFNRGHVEGTVVLAGCGGAAQRNAPPRSNCSSNPVNGAIIDAVPGRVASWTVSRPGHLSVVSPAIQSVVSVRADDQGKYRVDLAPGTYMVAALADGWQRVEANGLRTPPLTAASEFREIQVERGTTLTWNITILFEAA